MFARAAANKRKQTNGFCWTLFSLVCFNFPYWFYSAILRRHKHHHFIYNERCSFVLRHFNSRYEGEAVNIFPTYHQLYTYLQGKYVAYPIAQWSIHPSPNNPWRRDNYSSYSRVFVRLDKLNKLYCWSYVQMRFIPLEFFQNNLNGDQTIS